MERIVSIKVENIHPHPDNPRKDVGDVTELADSIKKNGIMQNLTVIPISALSKEPDEQPDAEEISLKSDFHALIGHRRLAAAKMAGLTEVPCKIVSKISKKEQVGIMLEENMQRNDLTIYEQAQGFQMMLDLGETEDSIAEKTGFSKTTIKHRLNIAKLDQKELQKKEKDNSFQLTLKDLYELEQVKDIKTRNKILKEATDSRNLVWKAQQAVRDAKRAERRKEIIEVLKEKGVQPLPKNENIWNSKYEKVKCFDLEGKEKIRLKKEENLFYESNSYGNYLYVVRKKAAASKKELTPEEQRRADREKKTKELKAKIKKLSAVRKDFAKSVAEGNIKMLKEPGVWEEMWKVILREGYGTSYTNIAAVYLNFNYWGGTGEDRDKAQKRARELSAEQTMLIAICLLDLELVQYNHTYNQERGETMLKLYEVLEKYGLNLEEEERQLIDGTHELYVREDKNYGKDE